ncbi:glycoside hydrolase family 12 protein [Amanita thiersii Skay4041]|uniref:Glycoside hydrolase family 12 protein n=1 Tax=Amanita thiersii Skay4041 TaxID=703135 RepID=A0A2A9NRF5_9AGAR|nr:glycoside hydrolase family 12 protein [Amanita thiersii Skay4041]
MKAWFVYLLSVAILILGSPVADQPKTLQKRGAVLTAQFATESEDNGRFILENNLWGEASATSGSQSSQVTTVNGNTITWHTIYTWAGGPFNVKSYANLDLRVGLGKALSSINSIQTSWSWTYTSASADLVADVSYDLWLSNNPSSGGASSSSTFEIMVWLSTRGGYAELCDFSHTSSLLLNSEQVLLDHKSLQLSNVNGANWRLFRGTVSTWTVFSFVAPNEITNFNSDLKPFFNYLITNQGVPSSQFLVQAQAGTEPFVGSATLTTNAYSITIN